MDKTIYLGMTKLSWRERRVPVFCKIRWNDSELSISGVEGPLPNGNCIGGAGQINMSWDDEYVSNMKFASGWNKSKMLKFQQIWKEYHLNDMQAGCEHQRRSMPLVKAWTNEKFFYADNYSNIIKLPLYSYCYECDYQYGTAWLSKEVPQDVIEFLFSLPEAEKTPAWI